jgi:hypothetical protein
MDGDGRVLVASVTVAHKQDGTELAWLRHARQMMASWPGGVRWFCAVEVDARGLAPFAGLLAALRPLAAVIWTYSIDKAPFQLGAWRIHTGERHSRVTTGRNLAATYAMEQGFSWVLYLDTDVEPHPQAIPRLVEVDRPICFGQVPTYGLDGPRLDWLPGDCRRHSCTAGYVLVHRRAFTRVWWGYDLDSGLSDDPAYARNVELAGRALSPPEDWRPVTRHDAAGRHHPEQIGPLEARGTDTRLWRTPERPDLPGAPAWLADRDRGRL